MTQMQDAPAGGIHGRDSRSGWPPEMAVSGIQPARHAMTLSTDVFKLIGAVLDNRTGAWKDLAASLESLGYHGLPSLFPDTPWSWDVHYPESAHKALTCVLHLMPNAIRGYLACDFAQKTFDIWERDYPDCRIPHELVENGLSVYANASDAMFIEIDLDQHRASKHRNILHAANAAQLTCFDGERNVDHFLRNCNDEEFLHYDRADHLVAVSEYSFYAAGGGMFLAPDRTDLVARKRACVTYQIARTAERFATHLTVFEAE